MLLISILLQTLTSFSQQGTHDGHVCLSDSVARLVAADLIRYDSVCTELTIMHELLGLTEAKVFFQDSIISIYEERVATYEVQISAHTQRYVTCNTELLEFQTANKNLTDKNNRLHNRLIGMTGVSLTLLLVILGIS